jgi:signal transduction histidine kinase
MSAPVGMRTTGGITAATTRPCPHRLRKDAAGGMNRMIQAAKKSTITLAHNHILLAYVADLELEVDRLRKLNQVVQLEAWEALKRIKLVCTQAAPTGNALPLEEIDQTAKHLAEVLRDLQELPGYHPAHDQVVAIAVRPLAEQVFRLQQRLVGALDVALRLELGSEHVEWFPARLRHILDNLISNALKYRDPEKTESWVRLELRVSATGYELRLSDNGIGLHSDDGANLFELFYRAAPARAAGLGVGLPVVKLLVEQSGGTLTVDSGEGQGTRFVALLPRYDLADHLI